MRAGGRDRPGRCPQAASHPHSDPGIAGVGRVAGHHMSMTVPHSPSLPRGLAAIARRHRGAISASQVRQLLHPRAIRKAVADGHLIPLWRGAYAVAGAAAPEAPGMWTRLAAAELTFGRPVTACLATAAEIHGFFSNPDPDTHVLTGGTALSTRPGLVVHRHRPLATSRRVHGVLVEDPAECAVRLAALQQHPSGVLAILDAALHCRAVDSVESLCEMALRLTGRGIRELDRWAPVADSSARSAVDSWIRWLCFDRVIDVPEINGSRFDGGCLDTDGLDTDCLDVDCPVAAGSPLAEADYWWPRYRVAATLCPSGAGPASQRADRRAASRTAGSPASVRVLGARPADAAAEKCLFQARVESGLRSTDPPPTARRTPSRRRPAGRRSPMLRQRVGRWSGSAVSPCRTGDRGANQSHEPYAQTKPRAEPAPVERTPLPT